MKLLPLAILEALVSRLIPPMSREHVLGDLSERYRSRGQYVIEALRTIPMVVASQVRRNWDGVVVAIEACALFMAFEGAWRFADLPLLTEWAQFLRLLIPVLVALVGFIVLDAYVDREQLSAMQRLFNLVACMACAFAVEIVVKQTAPGLALPWRVTFDAGFIAMPVLAVVHACLWMARRPGKKALQEVDSDKSPDQLHRRAKRFYRILWWRNAGRWAAVLLAVFPFANIIGHALGTLPRIWASLIIVATWCMVYQLSEHKAAKFLWLMFAFVAFGVLTDPAPDSARLERRYMGIAVTTLVFLLCEKTMRLRASRVRMEIEAVDTSEAQQ